MLRVIGLANDFGVATASGSTQAPKTISPKIRKHKVTDQPGNGKGKETSLGSRFMKAIKKPFVTKKTSRSLIPPSRSPSQDSNPGKESDPVNNLSMKSAPVQKNDFAKQSTPVKNTDPVQPQVPVRKMDPAKKGEFFKKSPVKQTAEKENALSNRGQSQQKEAAEERLSTIPEEDIPEEEDITVQWAQRKPHEYSMKWTLDELFGPEEDEIFNGEEPKQFPTIVRHVEGCVAYGDQTTPGKKCVHCSAPRVPDHDLRPHPENDFGWDDLRIASEVFTPKRPPVARPDSPALSPRSSGIAVDGENSAALEEKARLCWERLVASKCLPAEEKRVAGEELGDST
ncbi:hypothetical protein B0T16DRAFT_460106 [Cercophora newfieldiana]|uniref:Uncharacterized protein n=1 Tax=Cercophora newfieldiana TaxID=92897 RepID=A0AA39Y244_9PEZI|nr:hypothetical protein B0T16DRAFT_460106 [Cercophora newfieldiana]